MFPLKVAVVEGVGKDHDQEPQERVDADNDGVDIDTVCGREASCEGNLPRYKTLNKIDCHGQCFGSGSA